MFKSKIDFFNSEINGLFNTGINESMIGFINPGKISDDIGVTPVYTIESDSNLNMNLTIRSPDLNCDDSFDFENIKKTTR